MRILTLHSDSLESIDYKKINLSEFPDDFYVFLEDEARNNLFRSAALKANCSLPELATLLFNTSWGTFWRWYRGERAIKLENLKSLCETANIDLNTIQSSVKEIKGSEYSREGLIFNLPLEIDENWAYTSDLLRTDGHITRNFKKVEIANNDLGVLDCLKEFLRSIGVREEALSEIPWNKGRYLRICNKTFALIMHKIFEIPAGNKSGIIYIPSSTLSSPASVIAAAIRGAFDGDGWTCFRTKRIGITLKSKEYVKSIHELLAVFGIKSYFRGPNMRENKRDRYICEITRFDNLKKFEELIGFNNKHRKENLRKIVEHLSSHGHFSRLEIEEVYLSKIKEGYNKSDVLAVTLGKSAESVRYQLRKFKNKGILRRVRKGRNFVYVVVE